MGRRTGEEALTLKEAAERLGVKPQRISQMLRAGELAGPDLPPGRAPKNVGRVHVSSVNSELQRRRAPRRAATSATARQVQNFEDRLAALESQSAAAQNNDAVTATRRAEARERAALAVAATLKVSLDVATQSLLEERDVSAGLRLEVASLRQQLQLAEQRARTMDDLAKTFGDSLTQLLGPDSPETL